MYLVLTWLGERVCLAKICLKLYQVKKKALLSQVEFENLNCQVVDFLNSNQIFYQRDSRQVNSIGTIYALVFHPKSSYINSSSLLKRFNWHFQSNEFSITTNVHNDALHRMMSVSILSLRTTSIVIAHISRIELWHNTALYSRFFVDTHNRRQQTLVVAKGTIMKSNFQLCTSNWSEN